MAGGTGCGNKPATAVILGKRVCAVHEDGMRSTAALVQNVLRGRVMNPRLTASGRELQVVIDVDGLGWLDDALCAQTDPDAFFPEKGASNREAKKVCGGCEVRAECLNYALENDERFGIWGGLPEQQRRGIARSRKAAAA
jgi:hypothetical protein